MVNFERGVLQGQRNWGTGGICPPPPYFSRLVTNPIPHITSTKLWNNGVQLFKIFDLNLDVHALCFISNVYKQQFLGLSKFLKKLSNRTSLFENLKQHQENY